MQVSQRVVQLSKIRVQPVEPRTPVSYRLLRSEPENGKIMITNIPVGQAWKLFPKKSDGMLAHYFFAFIDGKYRTKHSLILGMWLAKVEVRHTLESSAQLWKT